MEIIAFLLFGYSLELIPVAIVFFKDMRETSDTSTYRSNYELARKYRESLYNGDKKKLTLRQKIAIIMEIVIVCVVIILIKSSDVLSNISIFCTVLGISSFQFYDLIIKNACTCSINFRYQIENHKFCRFKYAKGRDGDIIARNALLAFMPITLITIVLSAVSSFTKVDAWAFLLIFSLYISCGVRSLVSIAKTDNSKKLMLFFIMQMIAFSIFFCMTWFLPIKDFKDVDFVQIYLRRCFVVLGLASVSYLGLLLYLEWLWHPERSYVEYPKAEGEEGNYFEIRLKNGKSLSSKEQFFYPISHEKGILLLFLDGTSRIVSSSTLVDIENPVLVYSPTQEGMLQFYNRKKK